MNEGFTAEHDPKAAGESRYRGWRVSLNRFIWRAHIFTVSSLVVWVERFYPNRGYGQRIFSASARLTNRLLGVRVEVIGLGKLDPKQAYVFTPDHRSHVDITALMAALPAVRFAAKRELFDEPVLGTALRASGMIPIDRDDPAVAKRTLDEAAARLGKTVSVVIFPEGTRAPAGQMLPLKGGAFVFAIQEQVPVVPVALHNTAHVMPAHGYLQHRRGPRGRRSTRSDPDRRARVRGPPSLEGAGAQGVDRGSPSGGRRSRRSARPGLICRPRIRRARRPGAVPAREPGTA